MIFQGEKYMGNYKEKVKNFYLQLSINKKFTIIFTCIIVFFLLLFAVITYNVSSEALIDKTIENTSQNLNLVSKQIDIIFNNTESYSKLLAFNIELQELIKKTTNASPIALYHYSKDIQIILNRIITTHKYIDAIFLYDLNGQVYTSYEKTISDNISKKELLSIFDKEMPRHWQETRPSPYYNEDDNKEIPKNVISLSSKMYDMTNGKPIGIIKIFIDENSLSDLFHQLELKNDEEIFVIDLKGNIVIHSKNEMLYKNIKAQPYYNWIENNQGGKIFKTQDDKMLIMSYQNVTYDWTIVGNVPVKTIEKEIRWLKTVFLILGILFIMILVIIIPAASKIIIQPLTILKNAMQKVGLGYLDTRVYIQTRDEAGILADEFNSMICKTNALMEQVLYEQKKKQKYEYMIMQAQINPHFLYNTLETICGLAELERNNDVIYTVNNLALFYRGVLSNGNNIITIGDEIEITSRYLEILKMRFQNRFHYQIDVDVDIYQYNTLKLILQPLVENSIQHGFRKITEGGIINIKGYKKDYKIILEVIDNGCGIPKDKLPWLLIDERRHNSKGFGVKNINNRIKIYFGEKYGVEFDSNYLNGTRIKITLPVQEKGRLIYD